MQPVEERLMTPDALLELIGECPLEAEIRATIRSFRDPRGFTPLRWNDETRERLQARERPLPMSLLPVAESDGEILALDFSPCSLERSLVPVLQSAPDGFWRPVAESLAAWKSPHAPDGCPVIDFHRGRMRDSREDASARSLISEVLQRPLHTMASIADLVDVQERALTLEESGALDPLASRLSHAGLDAEAWRIVGAERAIAKRHRVARHALESAAFLGAPIPDVLPAWRGLTQRTGLDWLRRMLDHTQEFMTGRSTP